MHHAGLQIQWRHGRGKEHAQRARFGIGAYGAGVVVAGALCKRLGADARLAVQCEHIEPVHQGAKLAIRIVVQAGFVVGLGLVGAKALPSAIAVDVVKRAMLGVNPWL